MYQVVSPTILNQQVSADEVRQTRTVLETIIPRHQGTGVKFDGSDEIAKVLKEGKPPHCRAIHIRRAVTLDRLINSEEQSGPLTHRKTSAGRA
jgi:hypothetical protein